MSKITRIFMRVKGELGIGIKSYYKLYKGRKSLGHDTRGMYGILLCGDSEEDLRMMMGRFVEVHKRRGLKVNVDKSKVTVLGV